MSDSKIKDVELVEVSPLDEKNKIGRNALNWSGINSGVGASGTVVTDLGGADAATNEAGSSSPLTEALGWVGALCGYPLTAARALFNLGITSYYYLKKNDNLNTYQGLTLAINVVYFLGFALAALASFSVLGAFSAIYYVNLPLISFCLFTVKTLQHFGHFVVDIYRWFRCVYAGDTIAAESHWYNAMIRLEATVVFSAFAIASGFAAFASYALPGAALIAISVIGFAAFVYDVFAYTPWVKDNIMQPVKALVNDIVTKVFEPLKQKMANFFSPVYKAVKSFFGFNKNQTEKVPEVELTNLEVKNALEQAHKKIIDLYFHNHAGKRVPLHQKTLFHHVEKKIYGAKQVDDADKFNTFEESIKFAIDIIDKKINLLNERRKETPKRKAKIEALNALLDCLKTGDQQSDGISVDSLASNLKTCRDQSFKKLGFKASTMVSETEALFNLVQKIIHLEKTQEKQEKVEVNTFPSNVFATTLSSEFSNVPRTLSTDSFTSTFTSNSSPLNDEKFNLSEDGDEESSSLRTVSIVSTGSLH